MNISAGTILRSSDLMDDPNFESCRVLIAAYNEQGATGFVINKIFERPFNALEEFKNSPMFPLYDGGPVDKEHLFFIHRRNDLVTGGEKILDDVYLGGDFKKAVSLINEQTLNGSAIKIFIGYCGWNAGELEAEIVEGSWEIETVDAGISFL